MTGGAGFIGSHLVELLARDYSVRVVDNFSTGRRENLAFLEHHPHVEIVEGDIADANGAKEWCQGVDTVFHLAVSCLRTSIRQPLASHDVNAGGTLHLCLAALDQNVRRFVYVSSSEVYGSAQVVPMREDHPLEPITVYGAAKLAGELYALACHRTYGLPVVIVRPFNTYGPREPWMGTRAEVILRFVLLFLQGRPPVIFGDGYQTRDFTFVTDTARGILLASQCDLLVGQAVNIASGRETRIRELVNQIAVEMGGDTKFLNAASRPGDVRRHLADVSRARNLLDFKPEFDLADGLRATVAWFRQHQDDCLSDRVQAEAAAANW